MSAHAHGTSGLFTQSRQVWAVAFAAVVAFMGIGLVDPILPAIADDLQATSTEAELLFTSYLVITGLAMFVSSAVASRIGPKRTLMVGLALIVVFAAAAGLSPTVEGVIGFRAGWGLGNALFISTALATIVGAASGGTAGAIILYEAALGLGIAIGPLLGGLLGSIGWQWPFFGTATLMAIGFIAVAVLLEPDAHVVRPRIGLTASVRALRTPALAVLAAAALFYNIGFFVLLAWTPFPLGFGALGIGLTFFGWGVGLAVASVWGAPILTARLPRSIALGIVLPLLALDLVIAGILVASPAALVVCVVAGGLLLGLLNTILTEAVMSATDLPRSVASSAYSGVRFLGGAAAPPMASLLGEHVAPGLPYFVGGASVLIAAALVLAFRAGPLARVDAREDELDEAVAVTAGDAA
jgi:MFS transporter, ACDE family, multidrug resistance protein